MHKLVFGAALAVMCLALPAAAQDSSSVAFGADGGLYLGTVDGGARDLLLDTGATPNSVAWSPDGTRIAYGLNKGAQYDLFVYDLADGAARQLTYGTRNDMQPAWSSDGAVIAFISGTGGSYDIWRMDAQCDAAEGGCEASARNLTDSPADERSPSWSPDGESIAFVSSRDSETTTRHSIYLMDADGGSVQRITQEADQDVSAVAWSPDGAWLAYRNGGVNDIGTIEMIALDGTGRRQLARGDFSYSLAWSPDGAQIVYGCWRGHYYHMCVIDAACGESIDACAERRTVYDFGDATLFAWEPLHP